MVGVVVDVEEVGPDVMQGVSEAVEAVEDAEAVEVVEVEADVEVDLEVEVES